MLVPVGEEGDVGLRFDAATLRRAESSGRLRVQVPYAGRHATVSDIATHNGKLLEKTTDYYAQDKQGNVWYLGENTAEYSHGHVDHSGSWLAGSTTVSQAS